MECYDQRVEERRRILVVDDDSGIREVLVECLAGEGYDVADARNGAEGLERLRGHRPHVVLVDLLMPVMNGRQFIAHLRADAATQGIPVLLMTGSNELLGRPPAGADALLPKPFELEELLDLVRRYGARG